MITGKISTGRNLSYESFQYDVLRSLFNPSIKNQMSLQDKLKIVGFKHHDSGTYVFNGKRVSADAGMKIYNKLAGGIFRLNEKDMIVESDLEPRYANVIFKGLMDRLRHAVTVDIELDKTDFTLSSEDRGKIYNTIYSHMQEKLGRMFGNYTKYHRVGFRKTDITSAMRFKHTKQVVSINGVEISEEWFDKINHELDKSSFWFDEKEKNWGSNYDIPGLTEKVGRCISREIFKGYDFVKMK